VKLALQRELDVAPGAHKMMHTKRLVERGHHIPRDRAIANEADVTKQLIEMCLAVRKTILFIISVTVERLLTFGAAEMIDVKLFAECIHDTFVFDRLLTCPAYRYDAHLVVAT